MARTQRYGITFPIQIKKGTTLFDMNLTRADEVKSQLIHLIFTPEGQKLRDPLFGTKLVQYIYEPNDQITWDDIVMEVKDKVQRYVSNCEVDEITTTPFSQDTGLTVKVKYNIIEKDGEKHYYELEQDLV